MMTATEETQAFVTTFDNIAPSLPGQKLAWLNTARKQALSQVVATGLPSTRQENWKYTNVAPLLKQNFQPNVNAHITLSAEQLAKINLPDWQGDSLVFVDGIFSSTLSHVSQQDNVSIQPLTEALQQDSSLLASFMKPQHEIAGFHALNTAFMQQGVVIDIADNTILEKPLQLLFVSTQDKQAQYLRNVVRLGANASATLVENYQTTVTENIQYFTQCINQIELADNAQLQHYCLQMEHPRAFHIRETNCQQQKDSQYQHYQFDFGARLARHDLNAQLHAKGAHSQFNGLYMPQGAQHVDNHTRVDHLVPQTSSAEFYKGVLDGKSRAVFNGKVVVHEKATQTSAAQDNHNLLLSQHAEIDTKPELEIYNDDVKCSHGATVGQLDPNALFYLRSRGITAETAHDLLIYGFAHDVVEKVGLKALRKKLDAIILSHLPQQAKLRELL